MLIVSEKSVDLEEWEPAWQMWFQPHEKTHKPFCIAFCADPAETLCAIKDDSLWIFSTDTLKVGYLRSKQFLVHKKGWRQGSWKLDGKWFGEVFHKDEDVMENDHILMRGVFQKELEKITGRARSVAHTFFANFVVHMMQHCRKMRRKQVRPCCFCCPFVEKEREMQPHHDDVPCYLLLAKGGPFLGFKKWIMEAWVKYCVHIHFGLPVDAEYKARSHLAQDHASREHGSFGGQGHRKV